VGKSLRERATELGMKVAAKVFEDPRRAEAVASAIGGLQKAKAALDQAQEKALRAAGLVTREDFKSAGKRLSQLKRRCAELADELDRLLGERQPPR
jgi:hypothetical protein